MAVDSSYELPLHQQLHHLLPYLRAAPPAACAQLTNSCPNQSLRSVPTLALRSPPRLHCAPASSTRASAPCDESDAGEVEVRLLSSRSCRYVQRDEDVVDNLVDYLACELQSPLLSSDVQKLIAEERAHSQNRLLWDTAAGNAVDAFAADDGAPAAMLAHASGPSLDSIVVRQQSSDGADIAVAAHQLPAARRIQQVRGLPHSRGGLLAARGMYWVDFFQLRSSFAEAPSLLRLGAITYGARALHTTLNRRLGGEAATILESGQLVVSRLDGTKLPAEGSAADLLSSRPTASASSLATESSVVLKLPWFHAGPEWRSPLDPSAHWACAEYGEHPRVLLAADSSTLYQCDLRADRNSSPVLLFDTKRRDLQQGLVTAMAVAGAAIPGGFGTAAAPLVALASYDQLLVLDLRCLRAPRTQCNLTPAPRFAPAPRYFVSFDAHGANVLLQERSTGSALSVAVDGHGSTTQPLGPTSVSGCAEFGGFSSIPQPLPVSFDPDNALHVHLTRLERRCPESIFPLAGCAALSVGAGSSSPVLFALAAEGKLYSFDSVDRRVRAVPHPHRQLVGGPSTGAAAHPKTVEDGLEVGRTAGPTPHRAAALLKHESVEWLLESLQEEEATSARSVDDAGSNDPAASKLDRTGHDAVDVHNHSSRLQSVLGSQWDRWVDSQAQADAAAAEAATAARGLASLSSQSQRDQRRASVSGLRQQAAATPKLGLPYGAGTGSQGSSARGNPRSLPEARGVSAFVSLTGPRSGSSRDRSAAISTKRRRSSGFL